MGWGTRKNCFVALFFSLSGVSWAGPACTSYFSRLRNVPVNYCVHRSRPDLPAQPGEPVVYFFHGIKGDANSWSDNGYAEALDVLAPEESFPSFTVVSFDTAPMSFFSDRGGVTSGFGAYESWLVKDFIPYVEKTYRVCNVRRCRGAAGLSMGGFGALKTAFKHHDQFAFVAVNSAALSPFNVWNSLLDWNGYFTRHPIGAWKGQILLAEVRNIFTSAQMYDDNDPVQLAATIASEKDLPRLYLDVGGQDYFGFQEGYFRLTKLLDQRGWKYSTYFDPNGGHDIFRDRRWWLMRFVRDQVAAGSLSTAPRSL